MKQKDAGSVASTFQKDPLHDFAKRLSATTVLRDGHIVLRMKGEGAAEYCFRCEKGIASLQQDVPPGDHHIELIGDARRIRTLLEGKKDARVHFLAGGFRVRGDIGYISDLAMALNLLKHPL
jgi:hypothetical protein